MLLDTVQTLTVELIDSRSVSFHAPPFHFFFTATMLQSYGCPFYGYMGTLDPGDPDQAQAGPGSEESSPPTVSFVVV